MFQTKPEELFWRLYRCKNEHEVDALIRQRPDTFAPINWHPLGDSKSNFSIVENQQSNPVAALTEKLTNAMDAILVRRCHEAGMEPESKNSPRSIEDAVSKFFPAHKDWDLINPRNEQARHIQVLADGTRSDTSIIVYDDGEGQHPQDFPKTFLSLVKGNKQKIKFVHGRYNMGGTGALVFCGKKRYQLIASKRYDGDGQFGFTLIREHPLTEAEAGEFKDPWYEYLTLDDQIPAFDIDEIDLGLHRRYFQTGTVLKLYSYDVSGNRHFILDLAPSLNQFLYNPALPFMIVENENRYKRTKDDYAITNYGLVRQLKKSPYLEEKFSVKEKRKETGQFEFTVFVFKTKVDGKSFKETKDYIRNQFFKNRMQVLFTIAGQVHGYYTSEFISRTLQFNLLKDHLLIHIDCTNMKNAFRRELFMASRDRLKGSEEQKNLRKWLGDSLKSGRLRDIFKQRKDRITYDSADDGDLLKELAKDLPFNKDMQDLIKKTYELDVKANKKKARRNPKPKPPSPQTQLARYPSFMRIAGKKSSGETVVEIPQGDAKTITFESDVEDQYFDRLHDPGDLKLSIMTHKPNDSSGGDKPGTVNDITDAFSVTRRSPHKGQIKVVLEPTQTLRVGHEVQIQADLSSSAAAEDALSTMFWVVIVSPPKKNTPPKPPKDDDKLSLPKHIRVYEHRDASSVEGEEVTWESIAETCEMNHQMVMHPSCPGDSLDTIFINMDSTVLKRMKSKQRNISSEQSQRIDQLYVSQVYFHTLFLYLISKNRRFVFRQMRDEDTGSETKDVDLEAYLKDIFDNNYAEFLLNFESSKLMEALG